MVSCWISDLGNSIELLAPEYPSGNITQRNLFKATDLLKLPAAFLTLLDCTPQQLNVGNGTAYVVLESFAMKCML